MKRIAIFVLLLSTLSWAAINPKEYNVNIHVSSVQVRQDGELLSVIIDGKKLELINFVSSFNLLAPGDYKAKLIKDTHDTAYKSVQDYEFLYPDGKRETFHVAGRFE